MSEEGEDEDGARLTGTHDGLPDGRVHRGPVCLPGTHECGVRHVRVPAGAEIRVDEHPVQLVRDVDEVVQCLVGQRVALGGHDQDVPGRG